MKRILSILLALTLALLAPCALAGTSIEDETIYPSNDSETVSRLLNILDFKFFNKSDGIGYGKCPVYSAPYDSAYRLANGKAEVNTNAKMSVGGYDATGWLMVRYETNNGNYRVGYIPPKYIKGYKADVSLLKFETIKVEAAEIIYVTDNPMINYSAFAKLSIGETFTILGKYTYYGNWWYIECTVDGKPARGFIDRSNSAIRIDGEVYRSNKDLGFPANSPLDTPHIGTVTITGTDAVIVRRRADPDAAMVARVHGGEQFPCYGTKTGTTRKSWYYIWDDGVWGWVSSGYSTLAEGE